MPVTRMAGSSTAQMQSSQKRQFVMPQASIGGVQAVNLPDKKAVLNVENQADIEKQKGLIPGKVAEKKELEKFDVLPKESRLAIVGGAEMFNLSTDLINEFDKKGATLFSAPVLNRDVYTKLRTLKNIIVRSNAGLSQTVPELKNVWEELPKVVDEAIDAFVGKKGKGVIVQKLDRIAKLGKTIGTLQGGLDQEYFDRALKNFSNQEIETNPYRSPIGFGIFEVSMPDGGVKRFKARSNTEAKELESYGAQRIK